MQHTLTLSNVTTGLPYTFEIQYLFSDVTMSHPDGAILFTSAGNSIPITYPDTITAPSKITGLVWQPFNDEIVVNWSSPADNGKPIIGYVIWGVHVGALFVLGVTSNTVNMAKIDNLVNGTAYKMAISAINEVGIGQPSDIITVTPGANIPCLVEGQEVLTSSGFKCVEKLTETDRVITSDGRSVTFKLYSTHISRTTRNTAPYYIPAHTFEYNIPSIPITLSPLHAIQIRKGQWHIPKYAALNYDSIKQIDIGKSIRYYHIELPNYFTDNLVAKGNIIVESYGNNQVKGLDNIYKYNSTRGIFTRINKVVQKVHLGQ